MVGPSRYINSEALTIAIAKGRVLQDTLPLLARLGIEPVEDVNTSRRLIIETSAPGVSIVIVRSADVPTYVEFGAADLGVVGKDVLLEAELHETYELVDLGIAPCRMVVAGRAVAASTAEQFTRRIRIASKYPRTARRHFANRGIQADIIQLYGSMELAPLAGLAERIVDIVDTGATLAANGLTEVETICPITTRLIANKAASKLKRTSVANIVNALRAEVRPVT